MGNHWITTRNELAGFTEFVSEDVPVVVRTMHAGVDLLLDLNDRERIVGYRVYDLIGGWERAAIAAAPTPPAPVGDWQRAAMDETVRRITGMLEWGDVPLSKAEIALVEHIKDMPPRIDADFSAAKIGRWLGWVQGVSCAKGWLLLDDCKRINKDASNAVILSALTKGSS